MSDLTALTGPNTRKSCPLLLLLLLVLEARLAPDIKTELLSVPAALLSLLSTSRQFAPRGRNTEGKKQDDLWHIPQDGGNYSMTLGVVVACTLRPLEQMYLT